MDNIINSKGKLYYCTGSLLMGAALLVFATIFTFELQYSRNPGLYILLFSVMAAACLIAAVLTPYFFLKKGRQSLLEYITVSGLRFVISSVMLGYAFTKLRNGHMYLSYFALDSRLNDLDDFNNVWSFYGRYSMFQALIGILEFVPAALLLFRRTAFVGAAMMLPVVLNVVVLNSFYHIGTFTLPLSSLLVLFNLYVLYSYKDAILEFFRRLNVQPSGAALIKPLVRKSAFVIKLIPLCFFSLLILLKAMSGNKNSPIKGAYELVSFKKNNATLTIDSIPTDAYRKIYFEKRRVQNSLVNKNGPQGASITFYDKDSIKIAYRNGPLDSYIKEDTTGAFRGMYRLQGNDGFIIKGKQNHSNIEAGYKKIPLKEFAYWWE